MEIVWWKVWSWFAPIHGFFRSIRFFSIRNALILNIVFFLVNVVFFGLRNGFNSPVELQFLSPLDPEQNDLLDRTFRTFADAMDRHNVTFFLISGSLIGSVRHHGRIPWDDDIDVLVNASDRERVTRALVHSTDQEFYRVYNWASSGEDYFYQWKFFPTNGRKLIHKSYKSPFVDIFFFLENATHIWNASPSFRNEIWLKSDVFPLRRRPFGDVMAAAPCNVDNFLGKNYNISVCEARSFSHIWDLPIAFFPVSVPCSRLYYLYPFVRRSKFRKNGSLTYTRETLILGKRTLREFENPDLC